MNFPRQFIIALLSRCEEQKQADSVEHEVLGKRVLTNLSKARSAEEKTKRFQIVLELGTAAFLLTRRPSLLQKRVVPEWVESAGQLKKGQADIYSPLEETMRPLTKSAASNDRNN